MYAYIYIYIYAYMYTYIFNEYICWILWKTKLHNLLANC